MSASALRACTEPGTATLARNGAAARSARDTQLDTDGRVEWGAALAADDRGPATIPASAIATAAVPVVIEVRLAMPWGTFVSRCWSVHGVTARTG